MDKPAAALLEIIKHILEGSYRSIGIRLPPEEEPPSVGAMVSGIRAIEEVVVTKIPTTPKMVRDAARSL